jgi:hypothetical protein
MPDLEGDTAVEKRKKKSSTANNEQTRQQLELLEVRISRSTKLDLANTNENRSPGQNTRANRIRAPVVD